MAAACQENGIPTTMEQCMYLGTGFRRFSICMQRKDLKTQGLLEHVSRGSRHNSLPPRMIDTRYGEISWLENPEATVGERWSRSPTKTGDAADPLGESRVRDITKILCRLREKDIPVATPSKRLRYGTLLGVDRRAGDQGKRQRRPGR